MEDHNNEKRPRQQGRSNYTRRAPRANNNNQRPAPRRQRRKNHSPSTASRSAAVPRSPSRLQRAMR
mgnify:CR=1 FL=1